MYWIWSCRQKHPFSVQKSFFTWGAKIEAWSFSNSLSLFLEKLLYEEDTFFKNCGWKNKHTQRDKGTECSFMNIDGLQSNLQLIILWNSLVNGGFTIYFEWSYLKNLQTHSPGASVYEIQTEHDDQPFIIMAGFRLLLLQLSTCIVILLISYRLYTYSLTTHILQVSLISYFYVLMNK